VTTRFGSWGHRWGRCWTKQANDSSNLDLTAPRPQKEIDEYLARQAGYDPDIWVIEVEDRDGLAFLRG
jgi:hypothetical protein